MTTRPEKIVLSGDDDAPLKRVPRTPSGGARRVSPPPGEADLSGAGPEPVSVILSGADATRVRQTLDRLHAGGKPRRRDLNNLSVAALSALAARQWRDHLADELARIRYEVEMVHTSVNNLRASVLGVDPGSGAAVELAAGAVKGLAAEEPNDES